VIAAYANTFSVPFLFDDAGAIRDNESIRQLWPPWAVLSPPSGLTVGGRPLSNLTFAFNHAAGGFNVAGYHAVNLGIHVLAALVLFGLLRRTFQLRPPLSGSARPLPAAAPAFLAALIWALHPLQTESVTYLVQRVESLAGLFTLLTLYCFIRGASITTESTEVTGKHETSLCVRCGENAWFVLSVVSCLLGMASKEVAVAAPILVFLYDRAFISGSFRAAWRRHRALHLALTATWIPLAFLVAGTAGRGGTAGFGAGISWSAYALTQCAAVPHYLLLSLWPSPLVFDYGMTVAPRAAALLPGATLLLALAAGTLVALRRNAPLGFAGAAFFLLLAPSSSIVPVATQAMAEHRMYLALAAAAGFATAGLFRIAGRMAVPVLLAAAAGFGWLTHQRNADYRSDLAIWSDTAAKCPGNPRAHSCLGFALLESGDAAQAIAHYRQAIALKPDFAEAHNNLGNALLQSGSPGEAIIHLREALRLNLRTSEVHHNLGNALAAVGRLDEAVAEYRASIRLNPDLSEPHNNLGTALARLDRPSEAAAQFSEAIRLDPANAQASSNLGTAFLQLGRIAESLTAFERALRLDDRPVQIHAAYGNALARAGRIPEAAAQFRLVLDAAPDFPGAREMLLRLTRAETH